MLKQRFLPIVLVGLACQAFAPPALAATETVLYSFPSSTTGYPLGSVTFMKGDLFGAAASDGRTGDYGQIFKLSPSGSSWTETSALAFDGTDGSEPYPGPIHDSDGVLYGTTYLGDAYNGGNVFELYESGGKWKHTTVWAFGGTPHDGISPTAGLVMDNAGNLYGTTFSGGVHGAGTVFELSKAGSTWTETVLHEFNGSNGRDGWSPYAGLLKGSADVFYGTTQYGGCGGDGIVFELYRSGSNWKEKVLHCFTGGTDGSEPWGRLVADKNGNLYGTTYAGGASSDFSDVGIVFELVPYKDKWKEIILHNFGAKGDGWNPEAGLHWTPSGALVGTSAYGGSPGPGTVFEMTRSGGVWKEKVLHSFGNTGDGTYPQGQVMLDKNGAIYGTTAEGGSNDRGTVWEITP